MLGAILLTLVCITDSFALPTTTAVIRPCVCTADYRPVCGVDGITYGNKCAMDCANIALSHDGECPRPCLCPKILHWVCGQDGQTYANSCMMQCAGVAFFQDGKCTAEPTTPAPTSDPAVPAAKQDVMQDAEPNLCICPFIYMPVCGSDGVTYGNQCSLDCMTGLSKVSDGPCVTALPAALTKPPPTTTTNIPV